MRTALYFKSPLRSRSYTSRLCWTYSMHSMANVEKSSPLTVTNKENKTLGSPVKAKDQPSALKRSRSEENSGRFLVKRLTEHATLPVRGSAGAAGYDLASAYDCIIPARGKGIAKTDLSIAIPSGTYARVAPRSGLAAKHFIDTGAGVVDEDYRGNVGVVLFNHSETDFKISKGDRIAQLILERILTPEVEEVMEGEELEVTKRGASGYGSTGVQ